MSTESPNYILLDLYSGEYFLRNTIEEIASLVLEDIESEVTIYELKREVPLTVLTTPVIVLDGKEYKDVYEEE